MKLWPPIGFQSTTFQSWVYFLTLAGLIWYALETRASRLAMEGQLEQQRAQMLRAAPLLVDMRIVPSVTAAEKYSLEFKNHLDEPVHVSVEDAFCEERNGDLVNKVALRFHARPEAPSPIPARAETESDISATVEQARESAGRWLILNYVLQRRSDGKQVRKRIEIPVSGGLRGAIDVNQVVYKEV